MSEILRLQFSPMAVCTQLSSLMQDRLANDRVHFWDQPVSNQGNIVLGDYHDRHYFSSSSSADMVHDTDIHLYSNRSEPEVLFTFRHEAAHGLGYGWTNDSEAETIAGRC